MERELRNHLEFAENVKAIEHLFINYKEEIIMRTKEEVQADLDYVQDMIDHILGLAEKAKEENDTFTLNTSNRAMGRYARKRGELRRELRRVKSEKN